MKIEEAIEWMEETIQDINELFDQCSTALQEEITEQKEAFELALTALRSMPGAGKKNFRVITQADNKDMDAPANSVWISVKDQLPERFKPVLICREKNGKPYVEQGYKDVCEWWKVYGTRTKQVTHWMPLPEPPEEG